MLAIDLELRTVGQRIVRWPDMEGPLGNIFSRFAA